MLQVIDDTKSITLAAASTLTKDVRESLGEESAGNKVQPLLCPHHVCTAIMSVQPATRLQSIPSSGMHGHLHLVDALADHHSNQICIIPGIAILVLYQ